MLYIVATPIGNLEDFSQRAFKTLKKCGAILCEDTRRTAILMDRFGLKKPLFPYHKFNEIKELEEVISRLKSGEDLALVSDAGTPCINDPGVKLISACVERGIPFTFIPGPCSPIAALVLSGFETDRFQCIGFLPKKPEKPLRQALYYPGTTLAFESPERLINTLHLLQILDPTRPVAICREMTKAFEECRRGSSSELIAHFTEKPPKGEIVLVIPSGPPPETPLALEECVALLQEIHGLSLREAIKEAAHLLKVPKRSIYNKLQKKENN